MPKLVTIVRWIAVLPVAILSWMLVGMAGTAVYSNIPGTIGEVWRRDGRLPVEAAPSDAFLCFVAATTGVAVGTVIAPNRKWALAALVLLLILGTASQMQNALDMLRDDDGAARDPAIVSLWEAGGFLAAILLCSGFGLIRWCGIALRSCWRWS